MFITISYYRVVSYDKGLASITRVRIHGDVRSGRLVRENPQQWGRTQEIQKLSPSHAAPLAQRL
jgi:hypothetical protein